MHSENWMTRSSATKQTWWPMQMHRLINGLDCSHRIQLHISGLWRTIGLLEKSSRFRTWTHRFTIGYQPSVTSSAYTSDTNKMFLDLLSVGTIHCPQHWCPSIPQTNHSQLIDWSQLWTFPWLICCWKFQGLKLVLHDRLLPELHIVLGKPLLHSNSLCTVWLVPS